MRALLLILVLLLAGCVPPARGEVPTEETRATEGQYYRVVTWNVRNLFDDVDHPYQDETPSSAEYQQKLRELAAVLDEVDADFIALQEVENLPALSALNELLQNPYPQIGLLEGNDQIRGIDVAFLSRLPVREVVSHASMDLPKQPGDNHNHHFSRDCLEVRLEVDPPVILLINHFKSARGDAKKSSRKRRAQAEGVLAIARSLPTEAAVLVLGDLNGRPDEWALEPLFQTFTDPFEGLPREARITHRYRKGGSALDHILLDPEAAKVATSARIWSEPARQTSDHNPVSVEVKLSKVVVAPPGVWD
ncbi:MAG: endonuclease/exonuclease/phosphatase family protein [Vulcanimicrobiota bacterium]